MQGQAVAKTLEEKLAALPLDRRIRIEKHTAELIAEVREQRARQARSKAANGHGLAKSLTNAPAHN
jgi:hypothetical protein